MDYFVYRHKCFIIMKKQFNSTNLLFDRFNDPALLHTPNIDRRSVSSHSYISAIR